MITAFKNVPIEQIRKNRDMILMQDDSIAIKLRLPDHRQRLSKKDGFRLVYLVSMIEERVAFLDIYPKRGPLQQLDIQDEELMRLLALYIQEGDMSLIGPRPLLVQYLPLYSKEQARRHEVRPGITGWAQCHGRNAISWTEKFKHDVWYVDHLSFGTDLRIIGLTIMKVLQRADINEAGHATMELFDGTN